jgi:ribonuclease HI
MKQQMALEGWFDGAAQPTNPGPMGIGALLKHGEEVVWRVSKAIGDGTNNIAEWRALIALMEAAVNLRCWHLTVYGDSELVIKQCLGVYKVKAEHLAQYRARFVFLAGKIEGGVELKHVRREFNKEADKLSTACFGSKVPRPRRPAAPVVGGK